MAKAISKIDRFRGVMVGLAAGDALGAPLEFGPQRPKEDLLREMIGGGVFVWKPGEWTDDTQMALCISKSLSQCGTVDLNDIARQFVAWFESRPPDVGMHTSTVLSQIRSGLSWEAASARVQAQNADSAGNGSLMRTAPLALFAASSETSQIVAWSRSVSRVTHAHNDCQWSCAALNVAIVHLLRGETLESAVDAAIDACADGSQDVCERLGRARLLQNTTSPSGHVLATLEVAFWSLLNTYTFEDAVVEVVNRGDDSDTVGAVTGALAGAYYGVEAIPGRWRRLLLRCSDLIGYADDLHRLAVLDVPEFEYACIVPDRLYIGRNPLSSADVEQLVDVAHITHIVDLREPWEFSTPRQGEEALRALEDRHIRRLHIPVRDMGEPTQEDLDACVAFINDTLSVSDARIYLHCRAGRERSGSVAVAWYSRKYGISYDEALLRLQEARPSICPLSGQENAIRKWLNDGPVNGDCEEHDVGSRRINHISPDPMRRFVGEEGDIHCVGFMPVEPWIGRDGKLYPESLQSQVGSLVFRAVLHLHVVDGQNKDGPIVRYEVLDEPLLAALRGVYLVTKNGIIVYCGKFTNTFARRWLYTKGRYVYHFKRGIIADAIHEQHDVFVYAQTEQALRDQIGCPDNDWISATSIEEKLIRELNLRQQWNSVG